jgi:hypothetical protein
MISEPESDPIGQAIFNFHFNKDNTPITVYSQVVEDEELPPDYFFRSYREMPLLERLALKKCTGKTLDIGAGAGCHSLWLQSKKIDVTALEISSLCCKVMENRGIRNIINDSAYRFTQSKYDTILLLMNGIGIARSLDGLLTLLSNLKTKLNPKGKILLDSSDLIYLYEQEDGSFLLDVNAITYYGEIDYQLTYKTIKGEPFSWLFVDHVTLSELAETIGFKTKVIEYGPHYDYLAELTI